MLICLKFTLNYFYFIDKTWLVKIIFYCTVSKSYWEVNAHFPKTCFNKQGFLYLPEKIWKITKKFLETFSRLNIIFRGYFKNFIQVIRALIINVFRGSWINVLIESFFFVLGNVYFVFKTTFSQRHNFTIVK